MSKVWHIHIYRAWMSRRAVSSQTTGNCLHLALWLRAAIASSAGQHARLTTVSRLTGGSICRGSLIVPPAVNEPNGTSRAKQLCRAETRWIFALVRLRVQPLLSPPSPSFQPNIVDCANQANPKELVLTDNVSNCYSRSSTTIKRRSHRASRIAHAFSQNKNTWLVMASYY